VVQNVSPSGDNNSIETPVCVTFNESLQVATVTPTTLLLRVQGGTTILAGILNFGSGRFFVLLPTAPLPIAKTIEVVASNQIRDIEGFPLTVPTGGVIGSFKTEVTADKQQTPKVVASFPKGGSKNISPGTVTFGTGQDAIPGTPTQVITVFSEPISPTTILGNPSANPPQEGYSLTQTVDPDGSGPLPPTTTALIPGSGALLNPDPTNRIWIATPSTPFTAGATIAVHVGTGVTNDDVTPTNLSPAFNSQFTIAPIDPPQFVGLVTTGGLTTKPSFLNNVPPPNPNYAGAFTAGVIFGSTSKSTDDVDIQLHDSTGAGIVTFTRKAGTGAFEVDYPNLSILTNSGLLKLKDPNLVIAARTRRGSASSTWYVGPAIAVDIVLPAVLSYGPPAIGPVLYTPSRVAPIYGQASETPASLLITSIQSPAGSPSLQVPTPLPPVQGKDPKHLLRVNGNLFVSMPLIPAPAITAQVQGVPPSEAFSQANFSIADVGGNTSNNLTVSIVPRGRIGGPSLSTQDALTVVVYDEDSLLAVPGAVVLLDAAVPGGTSTGQIKKTVTLGAGSLIGATFIAGSDFPAGTVARTVTAAAAGYDLATVIAVPGSFISIPIRKTRGSAATNDPTLTVSQQGAPAGSTLDLVVNARPDPADRWTVSSSIGSITPTFPATTVGAFRLLFLGSYVKASDAFAFTFINDAYGFPVPPLSLGSTGTTSVVFGIPFGQTSDLGDDPVGTPLSGDVPVTLPGAPFDANSVSGSIEVGLFVPGNKVGVTGQVAVGDGRAGFQFGLNTTATVSFDPRVNTSGFFFVDNGGAIQPEILNPNAFPAPTRIETRAEDDNGNVSRALVKTMTAGGRVTAINLPSIPEAQAPVFSSGGTTTAPKIAWKDTLASMYTAHIVFKQGGSSREWRIYVRRGDADLSNPGFVALQLPTIISLSTTEVGSPLPTISSLVDQYVDGFTVPSIDLNGLTDFFFDDLRFSLPDPNLDGDLRFARGKKIEIVY
jgi:hypothetical protein